MAKGDAFRPFEPGSIRLDLHNCDLRLEAAEMEIRVRAAVAELSQDQIRVVELSFYEEKAHAEIAQILKIPLGTVKSRIRLAMNRLRNVLRESS